MNQEGYTQDRFDNHPASHPRKRMGTVVRCLPCGMSLMRSTSVEQGLTLGL